MLEKLRKCSPGEILRYVLCAFTLAFFVAAFFTPDLGQIFTGLWRIISKPSLLTKDYFFSEIGSMSGCFLNVALVGAVCNAMMWLPGATVGSGTVAAYMLTVGFSFFGINILNIWPFILGTYIYSRIKKQPFAQNINFAMFCTALSPLVSEVLFRYPLGPDGAHGLTFLGILLALIIGIVVGLAMPALCAHSQNFHKGYDLYNAGPAAGFLGMMIFAIMYKAIGREAPAVVGTLGEGGSRVLCNSLAISCFILCIILGLLLGGGLTYFKLLTDSGYSVDFVAKYGIGPVMINLGVYGLFVVAVYNIMGPSFTAPTFGVFFCMVAFCAAGATPLNVLPIIIGYWIGSLFGVNALTSQSILVGLCFASGMAPISGVYGPIAGVVAGILHYCLVTSVPVIHGGFNLYNGGFTSGLVAFLLVPVLEHFFRPMREWGKKKTSR